MTENAIVSSAQTKKLKWRLRDPGSRLMQQRQDLGYMGTGSPYHPLRPTKDVRKAAQQQAAVARSQVTALPRGQFSHSRIQAQAIRDSWVTTGVWKNARDHAPTDASLGPGTSDTVSEAAFGRTLPLGKPRCSRLLLVSKLLSPRDGRPCRSKQTMSISFITLTTCVQGTKVKQHKRVQ